MSKKFILNSFQFLTGVFSVEIFAFLFFMQFSLQELPEILAESKRLINAM